jgi:NAD(P)-dependent dehydrogenase (short-subunit alcohol dehydrogenase family)
VCRLAREGARVAIADIADCAETVELARQAGGEASGFKVDIGSWEQVRALPSTPSATCG